MKGQILIIEDEQDIRDLMSFQLKAEGHQITAVETADRAVTALERARETGQHFNLILVDWMLPGTLSGLEFTRKLRTHPEYKEIPVIMLTALTQPENVVAGLDAGADDYITKPFDLEVLQARVRVQMRSASVQQAEKSKGMIAVEELKLDPAKVKVWIHNEEIALTSTEYRILFMLAEKPGHVFTRTQLISQIQGENIHVTGRTIDTHIAGLRKKLGEASRLIETIRGIGYRFKDDRP